MAKKEGISLTEATAISMLAKEIKLLSSYLCGEDTGKTARFLCETYIATGRRGILKEHFRQLSEWNNESLLNDALSHIVKYAKYYDDYCELLSKLGKKKKRVIVPLLVTDDDLYTFSKDSVNLLLNREDKVEPKSSCDDVNRYVEKQIAKKERELFLLNKKRKRYEDELRCLQTLKSYIHNLQ